MASWLLGTSLLLGVTGWLVLSVAAGTYLGMALLHRHYLHQDAAASMLAHEPAAISPAAAPARVPAADSPASAAGTSDSITKGMSSWDS